MTIITSPSNPHISRLKDLRTPRGRKKYGQFLLEGPHLLTALLDAQLCPQEVYYQPELMQRTSQGRSLLDRLLHTPEIERQMLFEVSERVIEVLGDVQTSQGLVSILPMDKFSPEQTRERRTRLVKTRTLQRSALLILDDLADPGNMGTILRTALAADVEAVLLTPNCVDCYSPKVVRAAAGAHIALPIESNLSWATIAERVDQHCSSSPLVLLAEAAGVHTYYEQDLTQPFALIIGNEAHGPSDAARSLATLAITIPLANNVESLNAAMATGIILYEMVRQMRSTSYGLSHGVHITQEQR